MLKSLAMAKGHVDVEQTIIDKAAEWLMANQEFDGSFKEKGEINNKVLQGGAKGDVPLTAYVTIALLEAQVILKLAVVL